MRSPKTFTNYSFQVGVWATILFSLGMLGFSSADLLLNLRLGFTSTDLTMSLVVLLGAIFVKFIGTKIILAFSSE